MDCKILFEDTDMLVAVKPSGMPVQPDKTGDMDLLTILEEHCGHSLGLVHRLDRPVGGIMVFAKNKKAETAFAKQMQEKKLTKKYRAILCGVLPEGEGMLVNYLRKNTRTNLSEVVQETTRDAKKAVLYYHTLEISKEENQVFSLVEITLETGRHHQIRVQTAQHNAPILGDKKYNHVFQVRGLAEIALWSCTLSGFHPMSGKPWSYTVLPEQGAFAKFSKIKEKN